MIIIPRFLVCEGDRQDAIDSVADFIAVDVPTKGHDQRRGLLMHSTAETARGFISNTPGQWHIRCLDAYLLGEFMKDPRNRSQFDCVAVDYLNGPGRQFVQCFDADAAVSALAAWDGEQGEMPRVATWLSEYL